MTRFFRLATTAALTCLIAACASTETPDVTTATAPKEECVQTIGTSICRKPGSGNMAGSQSISGDALRKNGSGGTLTGSPLEKIKD